MRRVWLALAGLVPVVAGAQQPEVRVDAFWTDRPAWHVGAGLTWPAGTYARISAIGGYGVGSDARRTYRGELIGRLAFDPFRRRRTGLSLGGGVGVSREAYLIAVAELEGPEWRGVVPAIQFGASRGYRAGLVLRRAVPGRR